MQAVQGIRYLLRLLAIVLAASVVAFPAHRQAVADDPLVSAIDHMRNLEYDLAQNLLEEPLKRSPDDLRAMNALGTVVLYREMFQRGLLESSLYGKKGEVFEPTTTPVTAEFEKRLFDVLDKAQSLADARLQKDGNDHEALYWSGVSHGTRATYLFAVKRSYLAALGEAKVANKQHKQLLAADPGFVDADMVVGMQDYVVGSLPWYIKVLAALTGTRGDREGGLKKVEMVAEKGNYARDDARTLLAVLYQREERWTDARRVLDGLATRFPQNFLFGQELGSVCEKLADFSCTAIIYDQLLAKYHDTRGEGAWKRFWAAKALYLAGQAREKLGQSDLALARYSQASQMPAGDRYTRRAALADANLLQRMGHGEEARSHYQQIATNFPDSEEGKAARRALQR